MILRVQIVQRFVPHFRSTLVTGLDFSFVNANAKCAYSGAISLREVRKSRSLQKPKISNTCFPLLRAQSSDSAFWCLMFKQMITRLFSGVIISLNIEHQNATFSTKICGSDDRALSGPRFRQNKKKTMESILSTVFFLPKVVLFFRLRNNFCEL